MFLSWWRNLVKLADTNSKTTRGARLRRIPRKFRTAVNLEQLEDRVVPAAGKANVFLNVGNTITQVNTVSVPRSATVPVFIDFDSISAGQNGGGIGSGAYYVVYDPTILSISESSTSVGSDIKLGSLLSSSGNYNLGVAGGFGTGVVAISLTHTAGPFIGGTPSGHLIELDFHVMSATNPNVSSLLDLQSLYNDGTSFHSTFQKDQGNLSYSLQPAPGSFVGSMTLGGARPPSGFSDSDTTDASIQIVTQPSGLFPGDADDLYNMAPNNGNFPNAMTVTAANGVLANDTATTNGPMNAVLVGGTQVLPEVDNITSVTESGNTVTVTLASSNQLATRVGTAVTLSGVTVDTYNGTFTVTSVSGNQFTYTNPASGLVNSSGGTSFLSTALYAKATAHGSVTLNAADGSFVYTPTFGFAGIDTFTYQAVDAVSNNAGATATVTINVGGLLTIPQNLVPSGSTVVVPVMIASPNPANSGGIANITIGINYDATKLSLPHGNSDVVQGSVITAAGWTHFTVNTSTPGQIIIITGDTGGASPATATGPGDVVDITFTLVGTPTGTSLVNLSGTSPVATQLAVEGPGGSSLVLPFAVVPVDNTNFRSAPTRVTDGLITLSPPVSTTTSGVTATVGAVSMSTVTYGTQVTLTATVAPTAGTTAPSVGEVVFADPTNTNGPLTLGISSSATQVGSTEVFTFVTGVNELQVIGGTHNITATYIDNVDSNFTGSNSSLAGGLVVNPKALTITPISNTKTYDATTGASAIPIVAGLVGVDTVTALSESYDTKNVGTGKTLSVNPGFSVNDGNNGNDYTVTSSAVNTTGAITKATITITAATNTKVYDSTTSASATPAVAGLRGADTVTGLSESYDSRNTGAGKTLSVNAGYTVGDGFSGGDYSVVTVTDTTGQITPRALTVTATTTTKGYDGTTSSTALPSITSGTLAGADSAGFTETYDTRTVGTSKTLTAGGSVNDGNTGNNYTVTFVKNFTGRITARAITVTAAPNTKGYDGITSATATPTVTSGSLATGDTNAFTETYDNRNVGTGKTLTAAGSVNDGNSGQNYTVTFLTAATGTITTRAITVTAATNTKGYDGVTSATGIPTVTSGSLVTGDTGAFTESYDNRNAGTGKTMTAAGSVNDGNGSANYTITFAVDTTGAIAARALAVTAVTNTKGYSGTATATAIPTITSGTLVTGDTAAFNEAFDTKNVGTGKTLTPGGSVNDGNGGANYTVTVVPNTTGTITARALTVTALTSTKGYDGTTGSTVIPTITGGTLGTGDTAAFIETFDNRNVGAGKTLTPGGSVNDGNAGANYTVTAVANTTGTITARALTVAAVTDTKVYDGTTSSTGTPIITGTIATGDSSGYIDAFVSKTVGTGKTVQPVGSINDGNNGANYAITIVRDSAGIISPLAITVTATTDTKGYDGTTASTAVPAVTTGTIAAGDIPLFVETYDTKNVGTGKTLTATGSVLDGNSGANYIVTFAQATTGQVVARAISVAALTGTKGYDGTTSSTVTPTIFSGTLAAGDTAAFIETFDTKHVGTGKTLAPGGSVNDGNAGNNYTVTFTTSTTGRITTRAITVTAATSTKGYDGTTASTTVPSVTTGTVATGDTAAFTETFDNKNVSTGKTLTAAGSVNDGNGGADYTVTFVKVSTGSITKRALTVTSATSTKGYDGTTATTVTPTITAGTLGTGDTAAFTESFDTKNVGTGKTLTATGSVSDGNSGNNYTITFVKDSTGQITARALTVTAATSTKTYDATTASTTTPSITSGTLGAGDTAAFTESFNTKNVGTGKTLTATGSVSDGNSGNNYTVTFLQDSTGTITQAALTITAAPNTKTYDSTTSATALPTVTGLKTGDTVTGLVETYDNVNAGTGKTLTVGAGFVVSDGNGGANYTLTVNATNTAGTITKAPLTIKAATATKAYDSTTTTTATPTVTSTLFGGDTVTGLTEAFDTRNAGSGKTLSVTGFAVTDGNGGANYTVTTVNDTTGQISAQALTVTAGTNTKIYDGTTSATTIPAITGGTLIGADAAAFTESYDTRNVGTGKTLAAGGSVADGNSGQNYAVSFISDTTGAVTKAALTISATSTTKTYDGTISAAAPTVIGLQTGDTITSLSESFDTRNVGTGKTLTVNAGFTVSDGNGGNNYTLTLNPTDTTGVITVRSLSIAPAPATKTYDSTTASTVTPAIIGLQTGDTITGLSESYNNRNAGTGKTLTLAPGFSLNDGNGGNNYTVSVTNSNTSGVITQAPLSIIATTNTKTFDNTTSATAVPTVVGLIPNDTVTGRTEAYTTSIVGTNKTLTVTGFAVNDGNGGNNYAVTKVADTTGVITPPVAGKANIFLNTGASLTQVVTVAAPRSGVVPVFIDFDSISQGTFGGVSSGSYYIVFDPTVLTISETSNAVGADIKPGSLLTGLTGYTLTPANTGPTGLQAGVVAISLNHTAGTPFLTGGPSGHLIEIDFHVLSTVALGTTTLLDLEASYFDGVGTHSTSQKDRGTGSTGANAQNYTLQPAPTSYTGGLTQSGALSPSAPPPAFSPADSDTTDAAIQIVAQAPPVTPTTLPDTYNIAPNNGNFPPGSLTVVGANGVLTNDNDGGRAMNAVLVSGSPVTIPGAAVGISAISEVGSVVTVTTAASHTYLVGQTVAVSGVGTASYNGTYTITSVLSSTQFTYTNPTTGLASDATGSVVSLSTLYSGSSTQGGSVTINAADGSFTYTPALNFIGVDTFTYTAVDAISDTASAVTTVTINVGGLLTIPQTLTPSGSTVLVPVIIASPNPANSGGVASITIGINYDTSKLSLPNGNNDVVAGSVITAAGWTNVAINTATPGKIVFTASDAGGFLPLTATAPGDVVDITFTLVGTPTGTSLINLSGTNPVITQLTVPAPGGDTQVLPFAVAPVDNLNFRNQPTRVTDGLVTFTAPVNTTTTVTASVGASTVSSVTYGTPVTLQATVAPTFGTTTPTVGQVVFKDGASNLLPTVTSAVQVGNAEVFSYVTTISQLQVILANGGVHTITATYTDNSDLTFVGSSGTMGLGVAPKPLTVTALTFTKTYDATTSTTATPTVVGLVGTDTLTNLAETYDTRNFGAGKTLSASFTVSDNNGGLDYTVSNVVNTTGSITKAPLTIIATTNTKTFDNTNSASAIPSVIGLQGATDTVTSLVEIYTSTSIGTNKTLTVTGSSVNDGNGGNNYTVSKQNNTTGTITAPIPGKANIFLNTGNTVAQVTTVAAPRSGTVQVFIDFDSISQGSYGGVSSGAYYIVYDPTVLTLNETSNSVGTDIKFGTLLTGFAADYTLTPANTGPNGLQAGVVAVSLNHNAGTPFLTGGPSGHLIEIDFHVLPTIAVGTTTLLDLEASYFDGVGSHSTFQKDRGTGTLGANAQNYSLQPSPTTYGATLTQNGALTPPTFVSPSDSDTTDAAIQIVAQAPPVTPTTLPDTYNIAPNNGNFPPGSLTVVGANGVLTNDNDGGRAMNAVLVSGSPVTIPGASVGISAISEVGSVVTVTTAASHTYLVGQTVVLSGVGTASYNGTYTITSVLSSTQFTYTNPTTGLAADSTGSVISTSTLYTGTTTQGGTVTINAADGSLTYTPAPSFIGVDTFAYRAVDAISDTASAVTTVTINVGGLLTIPQTLTPSGSTVLVPVIIASPNPANSGGVASITIGINYDTSKLSLPHGNLDVVAGSVITAAGWTNVAINTATPGKIVFTASDAGGNSPMTATGPGDVMDITFTLVGTPTGTSLINLSGTNPVVTQLAVPAPGGDTQVLPFAVTPVDNLNFRTQPTRATDGLITFSPAVVGTTTTGVTATLSGSSFSTVTYGTQVTLQATVTPLVGTTAPSVGQVDFMDGATDLGFSSNAVQVGNTEVFTLITGPNQLQVTGGSHTITATYSDNVDNNFTGSSGTQAGSFTVTARALTIAPVSNTKTYDSLTSATVAPSVSGLVGSDTVTNLSESFDTRNVGTGKTLTVNSGFTVNDGHGGADYTVTVNAPDTTGAITPRALTITPAANTRTYDSTTSASATPTVSGIQGGDTVTGLSEAYTDPNAGAGKTLAVTPGFVVSDGFGGADYTVSTPTATTGVITKAVLVITAATNTRGYDGTTSATGTPTVTSGLQGNDTVSGLTEAYDTKNVGTGKTLSVTGYTITDGNLGNNYTVTTVRDATGSITARAITVTAATNTKGYDGTTSATGTPTVTGGSLASGDSSAFTETYDTRKVGTGKTLAVGGSANDGNSGQNYAVTFVANVTGTITARAITVTAAANTKGYDATTGATATPTLTSGSLATGDSNAFTESYDTKNVGTGKTLTSAGSVNDGNSGANYAVTFVTVSTGTITARAITVTAATNTKGYDGTTGATAIPTVTSGTLATGDSNAFTETYDTKNAGTSKTLTAAGSASDGNGGANYTVTFAVNTTGSITKRAITVTAATNTKGYDGATSATGTPTVTSGTIVSGDTAAFTESYTNKNVGTAKTLTAAGSVNDGNSGGNYTVTFATNLTGQITARAITVTAAASTKGYDGTTATTVTPTITAGTLATGDTAAFTETFNNKNAATAKTLTAAGTVNDGNSGGNYAVAFVNVSTGTITARALTVTAVTDTKVYDGTTAETAIPTITSGTLATGDTAAFTESFNNKNVATGKTMIAAGTVADGNSGANYTVTFATNTTGQITQRAITVAASSNTKLYDGTTTATALPTVVAGTLATGDTAAFTETYNTKNAGTSKTLTAAGTVNDGNSGGNYAVTFAVDPTGKITARSLTVQAVTSTRVYDGTTASTDTPTITSGTLATGDTAAFTDVFNNKNVGTGKTLSAGGSVNDGNSGANYIVTRLTDTTGAITKAALTITPVTTTKTYDTTTTAAAPAILGLQAGDTVTSLAESFDTKNVGTGKTLTVNAGFVVNDGNSGGNYNVTVSPPDTTGVITQAALTITAVPNTRTYDATTGATSVPTVSGIQGSDTVTGLVEAYDTRHVGTGKTLSVSAGFQVVDGNGGGNYTVTTQTSTAGTITTAPLTITAVTNTKTYDATTSATGIPTVTGLFAGDTVTGLSETYDTAAVGNGKTLSVSPGFTVNDGNNGGDYNVIPVANTTGAIVPGAFSKYVVTIVGPTTVVANTSFLFTVQATDSFGNPVSSYSGPGSVAIALSPNDPQGTMPSSGALNSNGFGFFLGTLRTAGAYQITVSAASFTGTTATTPSLTVVPSNANFFTVSAPANVQTGTPFSATVTAFDHYGNIVTNYNGTVALTSNDPNASTLVSSYTFTTSGPTPDNGVHTFAGLTLITGGNRTITATDKFSTNPIITGFAPVVARGQLVSGVTTTVDGFTVGFTKPFIPQNLALYGPTLLRLPDVVLRSTSTLAGTTGPIGSIHGTLFIDPSNQSVTFKATDAYLQLLNSMSGLNSVALPDGTYTITLVSGSAGKGFVDSQLGFGLDGLNNGGSNNFTTTFTTHFESNATPVLAIPDFARGPDSTTPVKVPNDTGKGIPVSMYNVHSLTDATFTVTYNPALLTIAGALQGAGSDATDPGATFTMIGNSGGVATFSFHDATPQSGTVILGDINAVVPDSAANMYQVKEQLQLNVVSSNGGAGTQVANAVHINSYLGDVTADHFVDGLDGVVMDNVAQGRATGFSHYILLDPAIIGDTDGNAQVDSGDIGGIDNFLHQTNPQIPSPPGLTNLSSPNAADPTLSLPTGIAAAGNSIITVPVMLDHPHPDGSSGMTEAVLTLTYDPSVLHVSASDITLGTIPGLGKGWNLYSVVDANTGQIAIEMYSTTPITATEAGSLVNINFHVAPGATVPATAVQLVDAVNPFGQRYYTVVADDQSALVLTPGRDFVVVSTGIDAMPPSIVAGTVSTTTLHLAGSSALADEHSLSVTHEYAAISYVLETDAVGEAPGAAVNPALGTGALLSEIGASAHAAAASFVVSGALGQPATILTVAPVQVATTIFQLGGLPIVNTLLGNQQQAVERLFLALARATDVPANAEPLHLSQDGSSSPLWDDAVFQRDWMTPPDSSSGAHPADAETPASDRRQSADRGAVVDQVFSDLADDNDEFSDFGDY